MEQLYSWSSVEERVAQTITEWRACAGRPWLGGPHYSVNEQRKREKAYNQGFCAVEQEARKAPRTQAERLAAKRRIVAIFPRFAAVALGLQGDSVHVLNHGFLPIGTQLAQWGKRFDPTLSTADLIQACRNAWTVCGLQPLLGEPMHLTPSTIGYSMLYPYSDNFLDRSDISRANKLDFSQRFRSRLGGLNVSAGTPHEAAVWAMVHLIEDEYPRAEFPAVYECLLAIHHAQEMSIAQLGGMGRCSDSELLRISCAKGGTSVLADACLVRGWLNEDESRLAFEWGALLQLGDDLQDVREDLNRGSMSLFSRAAAADVPLDDLVTQLLNFSDRVADRMNRMPDGSTALKELLRMSWRNLILMAVASAPEFFSPAFLAQLDSHSPFRLDFLHAKNRKLTRRKGLYALLFEAFLEAGDGEIGELPSVAGCRSHQLSSDKVESLLRCPVADSVAVPSESPIETVSLVSV